MNHSTRMSKRLIRETHHVNLPVALDMAAASQALVQTTYDHKEAVQAFAEKRKPKFEGR